MTWHFIIKNKRLLSIKKMDWVFFKLARGVEIGANVGGLDTVLKY